MSTSYMWPDENKESRVEKCCLPCSITVQHIKVNSRSHGHWSWHITKDSLSALTKIAIINFAIIIECNDDFASISFPPCNVETEITASTITPRNSYHIPTKHPILVFPAIGSELRMIDFDLPSLSSTTINRAPKSIRG